MTNPNRAVRLACPTRRIGSQETGKRDVLPCVELDREASGVEALSRDGAKDKGVGLLASFVLLHRISLN
jgi:hypothetical protein